MRSPPAFRRRLHDLYYGHGQTRFGLVYVILDIAIIAFFIVAPLTRDEPWFLFADYGVALLLTLDFVARAYATAGLRAWLRSPIVWVDAVILLTMLLPQYFANFGFLRVLRLWTLVNSSLFWRSVARGKYRDTRIEEVTRAVATLVTFMFVVTGVVYSNFLGANGLASYIDALYFTVTTLTTTGYGDVLLPGAWGRLVSIVTMLAGITLFIRLGQAIWRPRKVRFPCPTCGLLRHDLDAVHCKACGTLLTMPNDEDD